MKSCNVILDLTEDCMLRCSYCYINGGESHLKMNAETAINTVKKFTKSYKDGIVHLLLHGGEPLLVFDRIQEIVNYIYEAINTFFASSDKNINHFTNSIGAKVI